MQKSKTKSAGKGTAKSGQQKATVRDLELANRDQEKVKAGVKIIQGQGGPRKPPTAY